MVDSQWSIAYAFRNSNWPVQYMPWTMNNGPSTLRINHLKSNYMKRSLSNATLTLILIMAFCVSASAQSQRTRDKLFPNFQQDLSSQKKDVKADPRVTATSTRSLIFTNYRPGNNSTGSLRRATPQPATTAGRQSLPSDLSATEAAAKAPPVKIQKAPVPKQ